MVLCFLPAATKTPGQDFKSFNDNERNNDEKQQEKKN